MLGTIEQFEIMELNNILPGKFFMRNIERQVQ